MHLSIVLVAPARAENIGAAARAMKTMGFTDLRIVDSTAHLEPAARWVAHGSGDILDNITTYDTLAAALHDISFTVATTARSRASGAGADAEREKPVAGKSGAGVWS